MLAMAPLLVAEHPHGTVNNSYIVMLKSQTGADVLQNHMNFVQFAHQESPLVGDELAGGLRHVYDSHVKGYAGAFSEAVIDRIRQLPEVDYVEKDQIVRTLEVEQLSSETTQLGAPWVRVSFRRAYALIIDSVVTGSRSCESPPEVASWYFHQVRSRPRGWQGR